MLRTALRRACVPAVTTVAVLFLAACGGSDDSGHGGMSGMDNTPTASAPGNAAAGSFNDADVMFAQMMIPHHQQAVEMATVAETRATDPEVKALAAKVRTAQGPEIETLTKWLTAWGKPTTLPSGDHGMGHGSSMPGMMSDADMARLKAAGGKEFDKQFCAMMIAHHKGAIEMAQEELAKGANAEAKALAQTIATTQQKEIDEMTKMVARL